jgi:hypothetical protein
LASLSRAYALVGDGGNALAHASKSFEYSEGLHPFYIAYAHEALARAAKILNNGAAFDKHLAAAQALLPAIEEDEDRRALQKELSDLSASPK